MTAAVLDFEEAPAARRPRPFPRPRFTPTVNGTVVLTLGSDLEEHLDIRAARALLHELADAVDMAVYLAESARRGEGDG